MIEVADSVKLRKYKEEDAAELFALVTANRAYIRPWLTWVDATRRQEDSLEYIRQANHLAKIQEGLALAIEVEGKIAGSIAMHHWHHETKRAQVGYWLSHHLEGKGIMNVCLGSFLGFLFTDIGLNKIELHHLTENKRSAALAKRTGFVTEGIIRQSTWLNGRLQDVVVQGLLRSEWQLLHRKTV
ncbi:MAG: GNAT family protein [Edaphocola sp.]